MLENAVASETGFFALIVPKIKNATDYTDFTEMISKIRV